MNLLNYFENGYSYSDYLRKIEDQLFDLNQSDDTSGFAKYYSMNLKRIERLDKTFELTEEQKTELNSIKNDFKLLIISEGWCGDAAQTMPIVNLIMNQLGVEQRIVLRDENPELINEYLTDGAKSIPIYIGINSEGNELFHFGPRPKKGMEMLAEHKAQPEVYTSDEFHKDLQVWYNQDKGDSTFRELVNTIKSASF